MVRLRRKNYFFICIVSVIVVVIFLNSCDFFDNIRPVVDSYFPKDSYLQFDKVNEIKVNFSEPMNKNATTIATRLTYNGGESFPIDVDWMNEDKTMVILFKVSLVEHLEYSLSISSYAEDKNSNNLLEEFTYDFTTKSVSSVLEVNSYFPLDKAVVSDRKQGLELNFSQPMSSLEVIKNLTISPTINYELQFDNSDKTVIIIPNEYLTSSTEYTFRIVSEIKSTSGNTLKESFSTSFSIEEINDFEINSIISSIHGVNLLEDSENIHSNIESRDTFLIAFSRPLLLLERTNFSVRIRDSQGKTYFVKNVWSDNFSYLSLIPFEFFDFSKTYKLEVNKDKYDFMIGGRQSIVPEVIHIGFINSAENSTTLLPRIEDESSLGLSASSRYDSAALDVVFSHSVDSDILLGNILALGSTIIDAQKSNFEFSVKRVYEQDADSYFDGQTDTDAFNVGQDKSLSIFRIDFKIETGVSSGVIKIQFDKLEDTLGNTLSYSLYVLK